MAKITSITLKKVMNSKKEPTMQATVRTKKGRGVASAPQGTSAGKHEAVFMPMKAELLIKKADDLLNELIGSDIYNQKGIDKTLQRIDRTKDFSNIGGSVALAVSAASLRCAADAKGVPLYRYLKPKEIKMPIPLGKCIGGGAHSKSKSTDIQEFLSIPITSSIDEAVSINNKMHLKVKKLLNATKLDYEGGWIKNISDQKALSVMAAAANELSKRTKTNIAIGVDVAGSNIWKGKRYVYKNGRKDSKQQLDYMYGLIQDYGLYYVEDPFHEEDFKYHAKLTRKARDSLICGDDIFTTNKERLKKGLKEKACNSIIIKPNQIGTITQTHETVVFAKKKKYVPVISHRSGETKDPLIAELAVGWNIPFIKIGIKGAERTAKTNELKRIWQQKRKKKRK